MGELENMALLSTRYSRCVLSAARSTFLCLLSFDNGLSDHQAPALCQLTMSFPFLTDMSTGKLTACPEPNAALETTNSPEPAINLEPEGRTSITQKTTLNSTAPAEQTQGSEPAATPEQTSGQEGTATSGPDTANPKTTNKGWCSFLIFQPHCNCFVDSHHVVFY